jgi:hypothetical protein
MATENRVLKIATELRDEAVRLWLAARALADLGRDHEIEAIQLKEALAPVCGWSDYLQEEVRELDRRRQLPG